MNRKNIMKALAFLCSMTICITSVNVLATSGINNESTKDNAENSIDINTDDNDMDMDIEEAQYVQSGKSSKIMYKDINAELLGLNLRPEFPLNFENKNPWNDNIIALNNNFIAYTNTDGTASATPLVSKENIYNTTDLEKLFSDIVQLDSKNTYIAGVKSDGTVVCTLPIGDSGLPTDPTANLKNISQISAAEDYILGVTKEGSVCSAKMKSTAKTTFWNEEQAEGILNWANIAKVSSASKYAVGLQSDGKVVYIGDGSEIASDCSEWLNIVDIDATDLFVVGVTEDGHIKVSEKVTSNSNTYVGRYTDTWENIVKVSAYSYNKTGYILGLKEDGTVIMSENENSFNSDSLAKIQEELSGWTGIVDIYAGNNYIIGEKSDGSFVYVTLISSYDKALKNFVNADNNKSRPYDFYYSYEDNKCRINLTNPYAGDNRYTLKIAEYDYKPDEDSSENELPDLSQIDLSQLNFEDVTFDEKGTLFNGEPLYVTKETNYIYRLYKDGIASPYVQLLSVNKEDFLPEIKVKLKDADGNEMPDKANKSFVFQGDSMSISFTVVDKDGNDLSDYYKLYYHDIYSGSTKEYDGKDIIIKSTASYRLYAKLNDTEIQTPKIAKKYYHFNNPVEYNSYYPEPYYPMLDTDLNNLNSGKLMRKNNIVKTASGSNLSLLLTTNGTVKGAFMDNGNITSTKKAVQGSIFKLANYSTNSSSTFGGTAKFKDEDYNCVGNWRMITDIAVGNEHAVGLRSDGTVVAAGRNDDGQCDTDEWSDIVAVSAGSYHTVGLKSDGTVVAAGSDSSGQCQVGTWSDIYSIAANHEFTLGLKKDGTIEFKGITDVGQNMANESWTADNGINIIDISAGEKTIMGLDSNGRVHFVGDNSNTLNEDTKDWENIVSISAGANVFVGIDIDGKLHFVTGDGTSLIGASYHANGKNWTGMHKQGESDNWSKAENREDIVSYFDNMYEYGIGAISVAVGDYSMVIVDTFGRTHNVIFAQALNAGSSNLTDLKYSMIANLNAINGPTFINNNLSKNYSYDSLKITLEPTSSEIYDWRYVTRGTDDTETQGISYTTTFTMNNGNNILKVSPLKDKYFDEVVTYYYNFSNPGISYYTTKNADGNIVVTLSSSISDYNKFYYTVDGKTDPTNRTSAVIKMYNNSEKIVLSEDTTLKVRVYSSDEKDKSAVETFDIKIDSAESDIHNGSVIDIDAIESDTTWKKENSPYILSKDFEIKSGATLTIEPGVDIKLDNNVQIKVNGSLNAVGSAEQPISFSNISENKWLGINFVSGTADKNNNFKYINVTGAKDGILIGTTASSFSDPVISNVNISNCGNAMKINSPEYTIKDSKFNNNTNIGLTTTTKGSDLTITGSDFSHNNIGLDVNGENVSVSNSKFTCNKNYGIKTNSITACTVNGSEINSNLYNVYTSSVYNPATLDFTHNKWSNYTDNFIGQKIYDNDDNPNCPKIDFSNPKKDDYEVVEISTPLNQNNKMLTPITAAETTEIKFETACMNGTKFILAVYDKNNVLLGTYDYTTSLENESVSIKISDDDKLLTSDDVKRIKIFAWDTVSLKPQMKAVEIN